MKKNKIKALFENISDEDLNAAVKEIQEDKNNGIIRPNGFVRAYSDTFAKILTDNSPDKANMGPSVFLDRVETLLLTEAAFRWADNK